MIEHPEAVTLVEESFLGGAIYTCPNCQPPPPKTVGPSARKER